MVCMKSLQGIIRLTVLCRAHSIRTNVADPDGYYILRTDSVRSLGETFFNLLRSTHIRHG